ncbi:MAG: hypothetical protein ACTJHU_02445 [Mycetocola sp.]
MDTLADSPDYTVSACWARTHESPEWLAAQLDLCAETIGTEVGVASWTIPMGESWTGTAEHKADLVRGRVNAGSGQKQLADGYSLSLMDAAQKTNVRLSAAAGAHVVGRRLPRATSSITLATGRGRPLPLPSADTVIAAMVSAWNPLQVVLSINPVNRLSRRGGWLVAAGYRLWLSDEVATIGAVADGVTVTRLGAGTLLAVPDDWEPDAVVDAMTQTRELNGLTELPRPR